MGVFLSFILPLISLIVLQQQRGKAAQIPLSVLALLLVLGLVGYSIFNLGTTMTERFLFALPLLAFLAVGLLLYKGEPKTAESTGN